MAILPVLKTDGELVGLRKDAKTAKNASQTSENLSIRKFFEQSPIGMECNHHNLMEVQRDYCLWRGLV